MRHVIQFIAKALWRWEVVGAGSTLLYGSGVGAMYGDDNIVAAILYLLSIAWLTAKLLAWEETKDHPQRRGISVILLIIGVSAFGSSLFWIKHSNKIHLAEKQAQSPKKEVVIAPSEQHGTEDKIEAVTQQQAKNPPVVSHKSRNSAPATPPSTIYNAPSGIIIPDNKGIVTNPTVNNFAPPSRRITPQQHAEIVSTLAEHTNAIVWAYSTDSDTWGLAEDIYSVLKDAGWHMTDTGVMSAIPIQPTGCDVAIFTHGDPSQPVSRVDKATSQLMAAMKNLNLKVRIGNSDKFDEGTVKVIVGPR